MRLKRYCFCIIIQKIGDRLDKANIDCRIKSLDDKFGKEKS